MTIFLRFAHAKMSVVLLLLIINVFQASAQDFLQLRQKFLLSPDLWAVVDPEQIIIHQIRRNHDCKSF